MIFVEIFQRSHTTLGNTMTAFTLFTAYISAGVLLSRASVVYESSPVGNLSVVNIPRSAPSPDRLVILSTGPTAFDFKHDFLYSIVSFKELPPDQRTQFHLTRTEGVGILELKIRNGQRNFMPLPQESLPTGLDIDDVTRVLYMTDGATNTIEVIKFMDYSMSTLLWRDIERPSNILVDSQTGYIYWLNNKAGSPVIETAHLDGTNRQTIASVSLSSPTSLALDHSGRRLYWSDVVDMSGSVRSIESVGLDGTDRKQVTITQFNNIRSIAVDSLHLYLTTTGNPSLHRINKNEISSTTFEEIQNKENQKELTTVSVHENAGMEDVDPCLNGTCSHICVRRATSGVLCPCPYGYVLLPDQVTCQPGRFQSILYVADTERRRIYEVDLENGAVKPLNNMGMTKAYSLTGDTEKGMLYWSDPEVNLYSCNVAKQCRDMDSPLRIELQSIHALAINTKDDLFYMSLIPKSGRGSSIVEVPVDRGNTYRFVINDETMPISLAYDPMTRSDCLFWTDPVGGNIYRHNMTTNTESLTERVAGGVNKLHSVVVYGPNLYWSHNEGISMCRVNGKKVSSFLSESPVQSFALTENMVYYFLDGGQSINWARRQDTSQRGTLGGPMFGNITSMFYMSPRVLVEPPTQDKSDLWIPLVVAGCILLLAVAVGIYVCGRLKRRAKNKPKGRGQEREHYADLDEAQMDDFPGYRTGHIRVSRVDSYLPPVPLPTARQRSLSPDDILGSTLQSPLSVPKSSKSLPSEIRETEERNDHSTKHQRRTVGQAETGANATYLHLVSSQHGNSKGRQDDG